MIRCIGGVAAGEDIGFLFVVDMASTNIGMLLEGNWRVTASVIAQVIAIAKDGIAIRLFARSCFIFFDNFRNISESFSKSDGVQFRCIIQIT